MASSSAVASPATLVSTTRSTPPSAERTIRPYPLGSASSIVASVAPAPAAACAASIPAIASPVMSGMSPLITSTTPSSSASSSAAPAATASPVPRGSACTATSTPAGRCSASRSFGLSTTITRPTPASRAACSGHRIMGRPQIGMQDLRQS